LWKGKRVSVVFPVFNEEAGLLDAIHAFSSVDWVDEVIVVDNTRRIAVPKSHARRSPGSSPNRVRATATH